MYAMILGLLCAGHLASAHTSIHTSAHKSLQRKQVLTVLHAIKDVYSVAAPVEDATHEFIEEVETPEEETHKKKALPTQANSAFYTATGFTLAALHTPKITKRSSIYGRFFYISFDRAIHFRSLLI